MRILLANPPCKIEVNEEFERAFVRAGSRWPFSVVKKKKDKIPYVPFPFYLAYSAALLERENFEVYVNDAVALNQSLNDFIEQTVALAPDIILFETSTPTINYDLQLVKRLKSKLNSIICLAGPHVTAFPGEILNQNPEVDYIFLQEYELNFLNMVKNLRDKKKVSEVKGIAYRKDSKIIVNRPELIDPLDQLPMPARHLFPSKEADFTKYYWNDFRVYKPAIQMHSSRGCPFKCNFCLWNQVMYANGPYRMFSPKRVVDEMEYCIKKYGAREIYFDDDSFTINKNHVLQICKGIRKRKLNIKWSCMGDAMVIDEELIGAMADSGCIGLCFGVESGNKDILRRINKPVQLEKVKRVAHWCAKRKIKTHATFTFGLLGETRETMLQTLDFAKQLDTDSVQFSITTPFPGTKYYYELKERNLLLTEDWDRFDGTSSCVVKFENLTNEEIESFCERASGLWLRNKLKKPQWIFRQLYNLNRGIKGQGIEFLFKRAKRAIELLRK